MDALTFVDYFNRLQLFECLERARKVLRRINKFQLFYIEFILKKQHSNALKFV